MSFSILTLIAVQFVLYQRWSRQLRPSRLPALLVVALINAQYLVTEYDFFGYSLRVYVAIAAVLLCLLPRLDGFARRLGVAGFVVLTLGVFEASWRGVLAFGWGLTAAGGGIAEWASQWVVPLIYFCFLVAGLVRSADVEFATRFLLLHIAGNAFFALAQWLGFSWAWAAASDLRPISSARRFESMAFELGTFGYVPGLQSFSIPFSYLSLIGCVAFLCWGLFALERGRRALALGTFALSAVCFLGSLAALSRSSAYISIALVAIIVWRARLPSVARAIMLAAFTTAFVGGLFAFAASESTRAQSAAWDSSRMIVVRDEDRATIWLRTLELIVEHPFIPAAAVATEGLETSPHNHYLNALYYGGGLSGFLQAAITVVLLSFVLRAIRRGATFADSRYDGPPVMTMLAWSVVGYFLKGQAHNDSFSTGGTLGWILLGLLIAAIRVKEPVFRSPKDIRGAPRNAA